MIAWITRHLYSALCLVVYDAGVRIRIIVTCHRLICHRLSPTCGLTALRATVLLWYLARNCIYRLITVFTVHYGPLSIYGTPVRPVGLRSLVGQHHSMGQYYNGLELFLS